MKALNPYRQMNYYEITQANHQIMRRLKEISSRPLYNLAQEEREFRRHQEIVHNRKKWFLQARAKPNRMKQVQSLSALRR